MVEKGLKEQYTPRMKKLTFAQGKLLIKLVNRECNQSSYQLVKHLWDHSKLDFTKLCSIVWSQSEKEYHPDDEDKMIERIVTLVENGQL